MGQARELGIEQPYQFLLVGPTIAAFNDAFGAQPHLVCYAVKANSNLAILNLFARLGSGFDIVSGGELERVLRAGGDPSCKDVGFGEEEYPKARL
jgi:diaminopimelate decarboxylase